MGEINLEAIMTRLDSMTGWLKKIDNKLQIQNGKVQTNEKKIALLEQRHKIEGEMEKRVESWSRKKLLFYGSGALVFLQILIYVSAEFIKKMFN